MGWLADPTGEHPFAGTPQLPGMSSNDVEQAAQAFNSCAQDIKVFTRSIRSLNKNNGNDATRASILKVANHLKIKIS